VILDDDAVGVRHCGGERRSKGEQQCSAHPFLPFVCLIAPAPYPAST
jgi:hypothetical protein